ncbi:MAG: pyridoxal phosphate-dependent aminotransferase, partial [bacterium]|nr:pyridoxal phosphate-dependent aminotransferase [bacterium]
MGVREGISNRARWAYTQDPGTEYPALRQMLAEQWTREWGVPVSPDSLFIWPRWEQLVENLLRVQVREGTHVVWVGGDAKEIRRLKGRLPEHRHKTVSPSFAELQERLDQRKIQGAVIQLPRHHWFNPEPLLHWLQQSVDREIPVILVEPFGVREGSEPNPVLERMSMEPAWRRHITIVQPLARRYGVDSAGVPLSLAMVGDAALYRHLARLGEITYSRASTPAQELYHHMLLGLQVDPILVEQRLLTQGTPMEPLREMMPPGPPLAQMLDTNLAFFSSPRGVSRSNPVIDLSFGESEWQAPVDLSPAWRRVRIGMSPKEIGERARASIVEYLRESRGISVTPEQIVLGQGVHPLLAATLTSYRDRSAGPVDVWVPQGSYGLFYPTVEAAGVRLRVLETEAKNDFKVSVDNLGRALQRMGTAPRPRPLVLLNTPSNPAGRYYSSEELLAIAGFLKGHRGVLLLDDVFGLLDTQNIPNPGSSYVEPLWREARKQLVVFGGLSKEFGAGGLRMGWAVASTKSQAESIAKFTPAPDALAASATPEFLSRWKSLIPQHQNYLAGNRRL